MERRVTDKNRLSLIRPDIAAEWNYELNNGLTPDDVAFGSRIAVWWNCPKGHVYDMVLFHRTRKKGKESGCPYCANKRICSDNCITTNHPDIAVQWHPTKNGNLTPCDFVSKSNKKAWWLCEKGHSYDMKIYSKTIENMGCPYCSNQRVSDTNNLAFNYPEIAKEWHPTKNKNKTPFDVLPKSGKKVWWLCPNGHSYDMTPQKRLKGMACYYCSGHKVAEVDSLRSKCPELISEFHTTKNNKTPDNISYKSTIKVWWICSKGHEWRASPKERKSNKGTLQNCPYCSGYKLTIESCLKTTHPELSRQWNYDKNGDLTPKDVTHGSSRKVWWKCELGHEWESKINNRVHGRNCPTCSSSLRTSFPEMALYFYLKKIFNDIETQYKFNELNLEVDIYMPSLSLVIEYDGVYFHKKKNRIAYDYEKCTTLHNNGLNVIKIRENGLPNIDLKFVHNINRSDNHSYKSIEEYILAVFNYINISYKLNIISKTINIEKDRFKIYDQMIKIKKKNSLAKVNPELALEWHPSKNGTLKPEHIGANSSLKVWWLGECGHEWESCINNRNKGYGLCPYCVYHTKNENSTE